MSMFACLIGRGGAPVPDDACKRVARQRAAQTYMPARWWRTSHFAALLGSDVPDVWPCVAELDSMIAVGLVRLDNTRQVLAHRRAFPSADSDLALILAVISRFGLSSVAELCGAFAFVVYDSRTDNVTAVRDAFGVQRLYTARSSQLLCFSTRASLLATGDEYNLEYFAEFILHGYDANDASAFRGVHAVPAGTSITISPTVDLRQRYWPGGATGSPTWPKISEATAADMLLEHLSDAVGTHLSSGERTWAQLSGGMDSSAIVAVAEGTRRHGDASSRLGGVLTLAMHPLTGADMRFAAIVADHYRLRHEVIEGWSSWEDDGIGPPLFDQPGTTLSAYAVARRVTRVIRRAGGSQLLCGAGADLYLRHKPDYVADLLALHENRTALRELLAWATVSRTSFWNLAFRYAIYPNLPAAFRRVLSPAAFRLPAWFSPTFRCRYGLDDRTLAVRLYRGTPGMRQRERILDRLTLEGSLLPQQHIGEDNLDWRYPFLYRPLVEFALAVPREWHTSGGVNKLLLRASVKPLLPSRVVARNGKGGLVPQDASAIRREMGRLGGLLRNPILAQLGCIEPTLFRASVSHVADEARAQQSLIDRALQLELWLQLQDPHGAITRGRARADASHQPPASHPTIKEGPMHPI